MLPPVLPPQTFATVLLLADDDSSSAEYACARFNIADQIAICDHLISADSDCFLLITTDQAHPGITLALNCNDTGNDVPGIRFSVNSGLDDNLAFLSCLRRVIHRAVTPFAPYDLSAIVHALMETLFRRLAAPAWIFASANGVIFVINASIDALVAALRSAAFLRFMLPFEHRVLSSDDFEAYVDGIAGMKLPQLPRSRSMQRLVGMTWPTCIRENTQLALAQFVVPMSTEFREAEFLARVLARVDLESPSETVDGCLSHTVASFPVLHTVSFS
jgi:hypothetical protein